MTDKDRIIEYLGIQYGRSDVRYETWYSDWSKSLARRMSIDDILRELEGADAEVAHAARIHLRAVDATTSMHSQSQRRAQSRNVVRAAGERKSALRGALEIHVLFPEYVGVAA